MLYEGPTKVILVTTAEFGPSAQEFAAGKPLTLIGGTSSSICSLGTASDNTRCNKLVLPRGAGQE